jgi:hypothetical protein
LYNGTGINEEANGFPLQARPPTAACMSFMWCVLREKTKTMRVTPLVALTFFFAVSMSAHADWIAKQTQLADISKAATSTFVKKSSSVVWVTPTYATVKFNSHQASFGQDFTAAQDWSAYNIVNLVLTNKSSQDQTYKLIVQLAQDPNNYTNAFTGAFTVYANSTRHFVCYLNTDNPLPYGLKYLNPVLSGDSWEVFGSGGMKLSSTWHWRLSYQGTTPNQVDISDLRLIRQSLTFTGIADAWGQYTDKTWPGKIRANADFANLLSAEQTDLAIHPGTGEMLGTVKVVNPVKTLGKWTVVTISNGAKFLQHPNGRLFWSLGLNGILDSLPTKVQDRPSYFRYLPDPAGYWAGCYSDLKTPAGIKTCYSFRKQNLMVKYGTNYKSPWQSMVKSRMASWGFNTLGNDCDTSLLNSTIPFTCELSTQEFSTRVMPPSVEWGSLPDPYASGFSTWCQSNFKSGLAAYVANQNLMGAYVDNELSWGNNDTDAHRYNVALGVLASPSTQPAKIALVNQITAKYGTIAALNASWNTSFASFSSILSTTNWKPTTFPAGMATDFQGFVYNFAGKYFSTVRSALIASGLKSLYLGSRFSANTYEVVNAASNSVDILSFNIYRFSYDVPFSYYNSLKKPVLISEFGYTMRAMGTFGGPASMPGSPGRAYRLQEFLNSAINQPNVIGVHYYAYGDQPITGRYTDYENGGFGIVDITDQPYPDSVNVMRGFTSNMYTARASVAVP